jgi:uncharacterized protein DUF3306
MSESFLSRWSRRKRDASIPPPQGEGGERSEPGGGEASRTDLSKAPPTPDPSPPFAAQTGGGEPNGTAPQAAKVDPTTLPPIESIDAGTDVSAFLRPGVPADLAQAALRRAWVADPAIRDFVGLAENAWDFNKPGGVPGFEPLRAIDDVQRLAAHIVGALPTSTPESAAAEKAEPTQSSAQAEPAPLTQGEAEPSEAIDAAARNETSTPEHFPLRPRHGGALAE